MTRRLGSYFRKWLAGLLLLWAALPSLPAEEILFIGNSFTYVGGVPNLVGAIALAKGKKARAEMVTTGGKDWAFHLRNPETEVALRRRTWDAVVLQDYSTKPTHVGDVAGFMRQGESFYGRIAATSPRAQIILYETWAYGRLHPIYGPTSSAPRFASPAEMIGELHRNYFALRNRLQAKNAARLVRVAPVGDAFARCLRDCPEINLYARDGKHADREGSYLAALVLYATVFQDDPRGAATSFFGLALPPGEAERLQSVAWEVTR